MDFSRVTIFTGYYGSGKTELAINYALLLAKHYQNVALVDLDVVNPYFRSREKAGILEKEGIEVIFPRNLLYADLPIIPAEVQNLIGNPERCGVIDVGGDEEGAIALGSISRKLKDSEYEMDLVVNTRRTFTNNIEGIIAAKERIEKMSKLQFTGIVCNVNLGEETTLEVIKNGYPLVKEASERLNLPIKFFAINEKLLPMPDDFISDIDLSDLEIFPIKIFMNPPWAR